MPPKCKRRKAYVGARIGPVDRVMGVIVGSSASKKNPPHSPSGKDEVDSLAPPPLPLHKLLQAPKQLQYCFLLHLSEVLYGLLTRSWPTGSRLENMYDNFQTHLLTSFFHPDGRGATFRPSAAGRNFANSRRELRGPADKREIPFATLKDFPSTSMPPLYQVGYESVQLPPSVTLDHLLGNAPRQVEYAFNYDTAVPAGDWLGVVGWGDKPTAGTCIVKKPLLNSSSGTVGRTLEAEPQYFRHALSAM